jgi:hypothetical protein
MTKKTSKKSDAKTLQAKINRANKRLAAQRSEIAAAWNTNEEETRQRRNAEAMLQVHQEREKDYPYMMGFANSKEGVLGVIAAHDAISDYDYAVTLDFAAIEPVDMSFKPFRELLEVFTGAVLVEDSDRPTLIIPIGGVNEEEAVSFVSWIIATSFPELQVVKTVVSEPEGGFDPEEDAAQEAAALQIKNRSQFAQIIALRAQVAELDAENATLRAEHDARAADQAAKYRDFKANPENEPTPVTVNSAEDFARLNPAQVDAYLLGQSIPSA